MNDEHVAMRWLYARLSGDAQMQSLVGGRIYRGVAPQDADYPFVAFNTVAYGAEPAAGGWKRPLRSVDVAVTAWNRGADWQAVAPIVQRIEELLHWPDGSFSQSGLVVVGAKRVGATAPVDRTEDGERYIGAGAVYRIFISEVI